MSQTSTLPLDPVILIRQLDPKKIRDRLVALAEEQQALRVLLRAAQSITHSRDLQQSADLCESKDLASEK
jgi:hypothetical protein